MVVEKAKILVIDDDEMIVNALIRVLTYEGYGVVSAPNGEKGLAVLLYTGPDLVILDVAMPGMSGIEVCRRIKAKHPALPVLFLSAKDEVPDRVKGLESGGDDYLVKPFAFEELVARIAVLLRRKTGEKPVILRYGDLFLDIETVSGERNGSTIRLSATEFQMLRFFIENPERVLSKEQLLERVWGYDHHADLNIVEVYVRYLRNKLEANGGPRLIQTIRGSGYILREQS